MLSVASKHRKVESLSLGGKPERDASPRNATRRSANGKDVTQHTKDLEEVTDGSEPTLAAPGDRPTEAVQKSPITTCDFGMKRNPKLHPATSTELAEGPSRLPWACHFFKLDPRKYHRCGMFRLSRIADIRQHILRRHNRTPYCPNCHRIFEDSKDLEVHLSMPPCEARHGAEPPPGWRPELCVSRSKHSDEDRWYQMWTTLFHGAPRPYSPYVGPISVEDLGSIGDITSEFFRNNSSVAWVEKHVGPNANP